MLITARTAWTLSSLNDQSWVIKLPPIQLFRKPLKNRSTARPFKRFKKWSLEFWVPLRDFHLSWWLAFSPMSPSCCRNKPHCERSWPQNMCWLSRNWSATSSGISGTNEEPGPTTNNPFLLGRPTHEKEHRHTTPQLAQLGGSFIAPSQKQIRKADRRSSHTSAVHARSKEVSFMLENPVAMIALLAAKVQIAQSEGPQCSAQQWRSH